MAVRSAKAAEKDYKLTDAHGLQLLVRTSGTRVWILAYRFAGKQKKLTIGPYPEVSLQAAREARTDARKALLTGRDPAHEKRVAKIIASVGHATTFEAVSAEWLARRKDEGAKAATLSKNEWLLALLNEAIGHRPISEITAPEILAVLRHVERTGRLETARRLRSTASTVFRYAVATARATTDPAAVLEGATRPPKVKHRAAILDPDEIGPLVRGMRDYEGKGHVVRRAGLLLAYTFVRSSELRFATKDEFDLDGAEPLWTIPGPRMKMTRDHLVPLSTQAVSVVREAIKASKGGLVFPSPMHRDRGLSENTINGMLRRIGYEKADMCGHGFRRMASTILNEHDFNPDHVERQLAHVDKNRVRAAYNAAEWLPQRRIMMQWWADFLDQCLAQPPRGISRRGGG
jgi:integrase